MSEQSFLTPSFFHIKHVGNVSSMYLMVTWVIMVCQWYFPIYKTKCEQYEGDPGW